MAAFDIFTFSIMTVTPTFGLGISGSGLFESHTGMSVGVGYSLSNTNIRFPEGSNAAGDHGTATISQISRK